MKTIFYFNFEELEKHYTKEFSALSFDVFYYFFEIFCAYRSNDVYTFVSICDINKLETAIDFFNYYKNVQSNYKFIVPNLLETNVLIATTLQELELLKSLIADYIVISFYVFDDNVSSLQKISDFCFKYPHTSYKGFNICCIKTSSKINDFININNYV